jgi:cell shape-determining protein MreD
MSVFLGLALTFLAQALLGVPGAPAWLVDLMLPVPWLLAPILLEQRISIFGIGLCLGLAWDLVTGSVVGPGAIAWSAAGLIFDRSAQFIADRSAVVWGAFGAACAVLVIVIRGAALLPLGLHSGLEWHWMIRSALLTGAWSAAVGWTIRADLPARWAAYRQRKLR